MGTTADGSTHTPDPINTPEIALAMPAGFAGTGERVTDVEPNPAAWRRALADLLRLAHRIQPDQLPTAVNAAAARLGLDITIYLADLEQSMLRPVPQSGKAVREPIPITGTPAGRAFMSGTAVAVSSRPAAARRARLWVPLLDDAVRLGALELDAPETAVDDAHFGAECARFAALVAHLVSIKAAHGNTLVRIQRSRAMSEASELIERVLPPATFECEDVAISADIQPRYTVDGAGFDYAVDGAEADFAILDATGQGLSAAVGTVVALSAMRTARSDGAGLAAMARAADVALREQFDDMRFATGGSAPVEPQHRGALASQRGAPTAGGAARPLGRHAARRWRQAAVGSGRSSDQHRQGGAGARRSGLVLHRRCRRRVRRDGPALQ